MTRKVDNGVAIYSRQLENDVKCGCCNGETSTLYSLATNDVETEGLCAYCFLEMIEENGWKIVQEVSEKMTTEYSLSVHEWNWEEWDFVGRYVMYGFYEENPGEAEKDGHEVVDGKVKYLDEIADYQLPVMLFAYPLDSEPEREKIIEVCRRTNCNVVMK